MRLRRIWPVGAVVVPVLAGLGVAAVVASSAPTQSPLLTQKQQFIATEKQRIAQGQAGGAAAEESALANLQTPLPAPPCNRVTLPFPSAGINPNRQGGPFGSSTNFQALSSWVGSTAPGGPVYAVWSGASGSPSGSAGAAAVTVYTETLAADECGVNYAHVGTFLVSGMQGPIRIIAASGRWLSLSDPAGQLRYFDLDADKFALSIT
ncbi:MAG: hypothetical protein ACREN2_03600 [Candidatus Dormibacteria bacterium]